MPSVALINATADGTFSRGNSSRRMLMPTGMSAAPKPCSARPVTTSAKLGPSAATTDPVTVTSRQSTIIRRLPIMSARRETIGVATAPTSRVEVTSQDALSVEVPRISGKSGSNGTTSVCCSATTVPHRHRVATTAATGTARTGRAVVVGATNASSLRSRSG